MNKIFIRGIFCLFVSFTQSYCTFHKEIGDPLIGYVDFHNSERMFIDEMTKKIPVIHVYEKPSRDATIVLALKKEGKYTDKFFKKFKNALEINYEGMGLPVLERKGAFIKVDSKKWLLIEEVHYQTLSTFLSTSLSAYTNKASFYDTAEGKKLDIKETEGLVDEGGFDIVSSKTINNRLWLEVKNVGVVLCDGNGPKNKIITKTIWMPAFDSKGKKNYIFYSRGC